MTSTAKAESRLHRIQVETLRLLLTVTPFLYLHLVLLVLLSLCVVILLHLSLIWDLPARASSIHNPNPFYKQFRLSKPPERRWTLQSSYIPEILVPNCPPPLIPPPLPASGITAS